MSRCKWLLKNNSHLMYGCTIVMVIYPAGTTLWWKAVFQQTALAVGPKQSCW